MFPDYRLANSIAELFRRIPPAQVRDIFARFQEEARNRGMDYEEEDGSLRIIHTFLRPRLIDEKQKKYFHEVCLQMNAAFNSLAVLRQRHPVVRELLQLPPQEEAWWGLMPGDSAGPLLNFSRWDANANFSGTTWRARFQFFEVNGVGVGGIHYCPTLETIVYDVVLSELQKVDPLLVCHRTDDARDMLLSELSNHARLIGRPKARLGFMVDTRWKGGPNEFPKLTEYAGKKGFQAVCCDPRDLELRKGEICYGDFVIDVLYRDTTLSEFVEMEEAGEDMSAIRRAVATNRLVSSLGGELDHKSCFEIFSDPQYHRWFTPAQRRFFVRHILWTRLMRETSTTDPKGRTIDLVKYVRQRKDNLVFKPTRGFGGEGILLGETATHKEWHRAIQRALSEKDQWTIQRKAVVHRKKFPDLSEKGMLIERRLNVVCGFIAAPGSLAILGRASPRQIVNVAQGGGMTALLLCLNR